MALIFEATTGNRWHISPICAVINVLRLALSAQYTSATAARALHRGKQNFNAVNQKAVFVAEGHF